MRSYKEIADRVLERRDEYLAEKKKKRAALIRGISAAAGTGLMLMVGIGLWQNSDIRKAAPSQHENQYIITEYTTEDAPDITSLDITETETVSTDIVTTVTEPASESASSPTGSSKDETVTTTTANSTSTTPASTPEATDVPTSTSTSTGTSHSGTSASGTASHVRTTTSVVTTGRSTATATHTTRRTTATGTTTTKQTTTAAATTKQHQTTTTTNSTHPYNTTTITQTTTRYYTYATSTEWFTTTTTTAIYTWHTTTTTTTTVTTIWYTSTLATNVTTPPEEIYTWFYYDGYRYDIEDSYEMINSALDVAAPIGHVDPDVRSDPYTGLLVPNSIDVYKIPNVDPYYAVAIKFTENWEHRGHLLAYRNSYRIGDPPDTINDLIDGLGLTTEAVGFTATLEDGTSKYYDKYKLQQILDIIKSAGRSDKYIWDCPLIISISTRYTKSPIILRIDEEHIYVQAFLGYAFSITPEQYRQILEVLNTT